MTARETALKILYFIDVQGAYSDRELKKQLSVADLSPLDNALVTEIVYGVVKNRTRLDYIIRSYSNIRLKKISPMILNVLRIGVYQIIFLKKIPAPASVDESVKLAKKYGHKATVGFVNGILRNLVRNGDVKYPSGMEYYEVFYSHPKWIFDLLVKQFGEETAKEIIKSNNETPKTTIRPNLLKTSINELAELLTKSDIKVKITDEGMLEISDYGNIMSLKPFNDGLFTVQDTSAMLAGKALEPKEGETVVDVCAAPGGKTTHLAEMMNNKGKIYAFDIHPHRVDIIKRNAKRLGIGIIDASVNDATVLKEKLVGNADKVLADVPCSGLGIIRKKPDIKWSRTEEEIKDLIKIQENILINSAKYVKKGGRLVYSTCTINEYENYNVVEKLLKTENFDIIEQKTILPSDKGDGFYICSLRRK